MEGVGIVLCWRISRPFLAKLKGDPEKTPTEAAFHCFLEGFYAVSCGPNSAYLQLYVTLGADPREELKRLLEMWGVKLEGFKSLYAFIVTGSGARGSYLVGERGLPPWFGATYQAFQEDTPEIGSVADGAGEMGL